jgi:quinol monooxygenase YgiN
MIVKHAEIPVDPATRSRALELVEELAVASRAEPGVIDYRVTTDIEAPNTLRILEQYEDSAAAESHEASEHLVAFERDIDPHLAGRPELVSFEVVSKTATEGP